MKANFENFGQEFSEPRQNRGDPIASMHDALIFFLSPSSVPPGHWHSLAFPIFPTMLKRQANGPKAARKKKKGNATYSLDSLDPPSEDEMPTEEVRVWNISTSETTGRVMASRRTLKHPCQALPSPPEELSMGEKSGGVEEPVDVEDPGADADCESSNVVKKRRPKRKRVRVLKENDSVSGLLVSLFFD